MSYDGEFRKWDFNYVEFGVVFCGGSFFDLIFEKDFRIIVVFIYQVIIIECGKVVIFIYKKFVRWMVML